VAEGGVPAKVADFGLARDLQVKEQALAGGGGRRSQGGRLRAGLRPPDKKIAFLLGFVADADPLDPYVFWPPGFGSGSSSQNYGSGSDPSIPLSKIIRKTSIPTVL
jgi:hypothetical protein